jgi:DNA-binding transcriptional LysR family regulator
MNFTHLRYFHSVAKLQSFRRAAEVLGVSQPSLSRQVKILEHECGTELLKRDAKRLVLTQAGELLLSRIRASGYLL